MIAATVTKKAPAKASAPAASKAGAMPADQLLEHALQVMELVHDADDLSLGILMTRTLRFACRELADYLTKPQLTDAIYDELFDVEALLDAALGTTDCAEPYRSTLRGALAMVQSVIEACGDRVAARQRDAAATAYPDDREAGAAGPATALSRDTELQHGGKVAQDLMARCTYEIAALSKATIRLADELAAAGNCEQRYELRAAGARIHALNSRLMSYLSDDSVTLADAARTLHCEEDLDYELEQAGKAVVA